MAAGRPVRARYESAAQPPRRRRSTRRAGLARHTCTDRVWRSARVRDTRPARARARLPFNLDGGRPLSRQLGLLLRQQVQVCFHKNRAQRQCLARESIPNLTVSSADHHKPAPRACREFAARSGPFVVSSTSGGIKSCGGELPPSHQRTSRDKTNSHSITLSETLSPPCLTIKNPARAAHQLVRLVGLTGTLNSKSWLRASEISRNFTAAGTHTCS
jgi:hypothetical protein